MAQAVQTPALAPPPTIPQSQEPLYITWEEFLETVEGHAEWVDGKIIYLHREEDPETGELVVSVSTRHNILTVFLIMLLGMFVEVERRGRIFHDPFKMKIRPDLPGREPDVMFVASTHVDRIGEKTLNGPADLVIEVISDESVRRDRGDKFREYEQGGVREYWIIDPERQSADFYLLGEDDYYDRISPDVEGVYHSTVLPGVWLKVSWLWQEELPGVVEVLKEWSIP